MIISQTFLLEKLSYYLTIPSPAGYTEKALAAVEKDFQVLGYSLRKTNKGALIVNLPGTDLSKKIMISAHIDTLGGIVKAIMPDGKLKYHRLGGGSYAATEGENLNIYTLDEKIYRGSIIPREASTHIYGDLARTVPRDEKNCLIRLDEKVSSSSDVLQLGIHVGDIIAFDTRFEKTNNGFVKSRYLDDKACVAMLIEIARYLKAEGIKPAFDTYFYISNYEEVGHGISAIDSDISELLALDIGPVGGEQNASEFAVSIAAKDNKGPYDYAFRKHLIALCQNHDIPYRIDVYNRYSSDATAAVHHGFDVRHACIGPGVDATHHYERTHWDSLAATTQLIFHYLMNE